MIIAHDTIVKFLLCFLVIKAKQNHLQRGNGSLAGRLIGDFLSLDGRERSHRPQAKPLFIDVQQSNATAI
jgi:hypothetical protein